MIKQLVLFTLSFVVFSAWALSPYYFEFKEKDVFYDHAVVSDLIYVHNSTFKVSICPYKTFCSSASTDTPEKNIIVLESKYGTLRVDNKDWHNMVDIGDKVYIDGYLHKIWKNKVSYLENKIQDVEIDKVKVSVMRILE